MTTMTATTSIPTLSFADILDQEMPAPPPSFADIIKSFSKDGNGDSQTLLAILSAKQAEEDRLAKTLEIRIQLLQMHAMRIGMIPLPPSPGSLPQRIAGPSSSPSMHVSSSTSSAPSSGRMVDSLALPLPSPSSRSRASLSPSSVPSSLRRTSSTRGEENRERIELAPISPRSQQSRAGALPSLSPVLAGKRKFSSSSSSSSPSPCESTDESSRQRKRTRSDTVSTTNLIDEQLSLSRRSSSVDQERSRSNSASDGTRAGSGSPGRRCNGLEMLLNAAEMGSVSE